MRRRKEHPHPRLEADADKVLGSRSAASARSKPRVSTPAARMALSAVPGARGAAPGTGEPCSIFSTMYDGDTGDTGGSNFVHAQRGTSGGGKEVTLDSDSCQVGIDAEKDALPLTAFQRMVAASSRRTQNVGAAPHVPAAPHPFAPSRALSREPNTVESAESNASTTGAAGQASDDEEQVSRSRRKSREPRWKRPDAPQGDKLQRAVANRSEADLDKAQIVELRKLPSDQQGLLAAQVSELSALCFDEDSIAELEKRDGWFIAVCCVDVTLLGYTVHRRWPPPLRMFVILRLAVVHGSRCKGIGRRLVDWTMRLAQMMPQSQCVKVGLSALPAAIGFYERQGFARGKSVAPPTAAGEEDDGLIQCREQQVWMERRLERPGGSRQRSRSRRQGR